MVNSSQKVPQHTEAADVRVWFVSACIFAFTISCSLVVLLAMETTSSDLLFTHGSDIYSMAVASAVLASTVLIGTFLLIVSVWFHLRRIQLPSLVGTGTFTLTIGFTLYWAVALATGHWNKHMEDNYYNKYWYPFINNSAVTEAIEGSGLLSSSSSQQKDAAAAVSAYFTPSSYVNARIAALTLEVRGDGQHNNNSSSATTDDASIVYDAIIEESFRRDSSFLLLPSKEEIHEILATETVGRSAQLKSRSRYAKRLTATCPYAVPSLHCCGWDSDCPNNCNMTSCRKAAEAEASDFAIKVIIICALIVLLVAICAAITMWRNCGALKDDDEDE